MLVRKFQDGTYYLCCIKKGVRSSRNNKNIEMKNAWLVKCTKTSVGGIQLSHNSITIPNELIGKKIMFKVEVDEMRSVDVDELEIKK